MFTFTCNRSTQKHLKQKLKYSRVKLSTSVLIKITSISFRNKKWTTAVCGHVSQAGGDDVRPLTSPGEETSSYPEGFAAGGRGGRDTKCSYGVFSLKILNMMHHYVEFSVLSDCEQICFSSQLKSEHLNLTWKHPDDVSFNLCCDVVRYTGQRCIMSVC